jgi:hypothetical protein
MSETATGTGEDAYGGILGAFPYAVRTSDSWLFRSYAVVGGLLAAGIALLFTAALVLLIARTTGTAGGVFTLSRSFFVVVGRLVVGPLVAPVLLVARRHRRGSPDRRYDAALAAAGYVYVVATTPGAVASVPPAQQQPPAGVFAPAIRLLYDLPAVAGVVPPALAAALMGLVYRLLR